MDRKKNSDINRDADIDADIDEDIEIGLISDNKKNIDYTKITDLRILNILKDILKYLNDTNNINIDQFDILDCEKTHIVTRINKIIENKYSNIIDEKELIKLLIILNSLKNMNYEQELNKLKLHQTKAVKYDKVIFFFTISFSIIFFICIIASVIKSLH